MKFIVFRFLFVYFLLTISPWLWFAYLPVVSYIGDLHHSVNEPFVKFVNAHLLHVKPELNMYGQGSGDTSFAWAQFYTFLLLALFTSLVWAWIDRRRLLPRKGLHIFLWTMLRYYISMIAFSYGIIKLFALQMPFPNLNMLATPLGDLLPMRLSWMFIGYSTPYQVYLGIAEVTVGLLLLFRRTVTLGALVGFGVFLNVFIMNLSYDIPVKLFSMQMVIYCLFLICYDWQRLWNFFIANKPVEAPIQYPLAFTKKWHRITHVVIKLTLTGLFIGIPLMQAINRHGEEVKLTVLKPLKHGIYHITEFKKNNEIVPIALNDPMSWKDFIFDKEGIGSIHTQDSMFRQRYRRGYFDYRADTINHTIAFRYNKQAVLPIFQLQYKIIDDRQLELWGKVRNDSLYFALERSDRHFQLAERQFHWISEANR